jgi:hypothetical protein
MPSRYDRPALKPPSLDDLPIYLRDARPTSYERRVEPAATQRRCVEAVAALLQLARGAAANADEWLNMVEGRPHEARSCLGAIPRDLRSFLETEGMRILLADDPMSALADFLGRRDRQRPLEDNKRRDLIITADVAKKVEAGMSKTKARKEVAKEAKLSYESVRKIHPKYRGSDEALLIRTTVGDVVNSGN